MLGGLAVSNPAAAADYVYIGANLFGEQIAGGAGHETAVADFAGEADLDTGEFCYYLEIDGFTDTLSATIHEGRSGRDGPQVLELTLPPDPSDEVCITADSALLRKLDQDAEDYYVIIVSEAYPEGALRGQMR